MAPGFKSGGRRKGSLNKVTRQQRAEMIASGLTPLDYMLSVMRDEQADTATRLEAAGRAAPYVHPRLSTIDNTHRGPDGGPILAVYHIADRPMTEEEWERERCGKG